MRDFILKWSMGRPRLVYALTALAVVATGAMMPLIHIDTDPENMLRADQPERVFHNAVEERFALHDAIVVGVVNDGPRGVFNPQTLEALHRVTERVLEIEGVIVPDLMSLSEADNITQGGQGSLRFEWMMKEPPADMEGAERIRDAVNRLPLLRDTLVSGDGKAAAVYVPLESKDLSYPVSRRIGEIVADESAAGEWHITGLPVAEDTFGHEMFVQMAISAPLAALMIFILMWYFFRNIRLIISPMIVAIGTVIVTMGMLIGLGFTVHIMSSMIPIFLMPIAVVDSIHIMSEFADHYSKGDNARDVMRRVVGHLFKPMLFTSLTSAVGFASLMLTPIPPVQIFGAFVAFGILLAFLLTIVFILGSSKQAGITREPRPSALGYGQRQPFGALSRQGGAVCIFALRCDRGCQCPGAGCEYRGRAADRDQRQPGAVVQGKPSNSCCRYRAERAFRRHLRCILRPEP